MYENMKVLVVDDYATMRRVIINTMRQIGFSLENINEADNGISALTKIKADKYDLIVSDWNMPKMTGIDLLKTIRASDTRFKNIPFLMVTAETDKGNVIEAIKSGVSNYIIKPFTPATLQEKLKKVFK